MALVRRVAPPSAVQREERLAREGVDAVVRMEFQIQDERLVDSVGEAVPLVESRIARRHPAEMEGPPPSFFAPPEVAPPDAVSPDAAPPPQPETASTRAQAATVRPILVALTATRHRASDLLGRDHVVAIRVVEANVRAAGQ